MTTGSERPRTLPWLDLAKAAALLWIVLNHSVEQVVGGAFLGNPSASWPPLHDRIVQLVLPAGNGFLGLVWLVIRDLAWIGDEGVGVFLVISGLGLAWALEAGAARRLHLKAFLARRIGRIYPTWWTAHAMLGLPLTILGKISLPVLVLSALGIRFLPKTVYAIVPAWWYIGLLLQLYAIFPVLWWARRRFGLTTTLGAAITFGLAWRAAVVLFAGPYVDELSRGAIFVSRLPEFAFGIGLAAWFSGDARRLTAWLRSSRVVALAALIFVVGNICALTLAGEIIAPLLTSAGAFVLVAAAVAVMRSPAMSWIGKHSFAIYLVHQTAIIALARGGWERQLGGLAIALLLTPFLALGLERITAFLTSTIYRRAAVGRLAAAAAAIAMLLYAGEWAVRQFDPTETLGWGERPSLIADNTVGWKLRPSSVTHLRWEHYDYVVRSNSLGFPGPEPPRTHPRGTSIIMTVGNAFTSAEGVDTDRSWPRYLERDDSAVRVANFAITGHGPNQYAAVVHAYGPKLRPDVIIVGMYVKDFHDSLVPDVIFQRGIGFDRMPADSPLAFAELTQLSTYVRERIVMPLYASLHHRPNPEGYFLGSFEYFDARHAVTAQEYEATLARVREIRDDAARWQGRVIIALFPAAAQVCRPDELRYYPNYVTFSDAGFDRERAQRLIGRVAHDLHVGFIDMRGAFSGPTCGYQPQNMHLTERGQHMSSAFLLRALRPVIAAVQK